MIFLGFATTAWSQQDSVVAVDTFPLNDTLSLVANDTLSIAALDSLGRDSILQDTMISGSLPITYSQDALSDPVDYAAKDSIVYDLVNKKIFLYGAASVKYTTLSMEADYIILDWEKNEITAEYRQDSTGQKIGLPAFQDGDQAFTSNKMRYNFKTKKGIIYDATSKYNDLYILGKRAKFISGHPDSLEQKDYIYSENAIFTTCDHPEPHFGIRSRKQKLVPNDVVVVGPSNLEIMGIPTPLWLPFGFFPVTQKKRAGILFPNYEYSPEWGFGLLDLGYYTPINDYLDLKVLADLYYKGTFNIDVVSQYNKRYKYNGSISLGYLNQQEEQPDASILRRTALSLRWSHSQSAQAHPYQSLSGSVNIQTSGYQGLARNDAESQLTNTLNSNVNYKRSFATLPMSFTASMSHSQNTRTNLMTINLPTTDLATQTLFPFKRKKRIGKEKWYEQITFRYKNQFRNQITATDTTLFTQETLDNARYGMRHEASSGTSFKALKYINVSPNVSYNEVWYLKTLDRRFVKDTIIDETTLDTLSLGSIEDFQNNGFRRYRQLNAGISLNTQIFGQWTSKKGWLRGVRHIMKPTVSMNYSPSNQNENLGYFDTVQYEDIDGNIIEEEYSIFQDGIYGAPSDRGLQTSISYSITNNIEAKYYSKKDSTENKFSLVDNFTVSGSYNAAADSLKFSKISMRGTTRLFKGITTLNINATYDPYNIDETGKRRESFYWNTNRRIARFEGAELRLNSTIAIKKVRELIRDGFGSNSNERESSDQKKEEQEDDLLSLFERFGIRHVFNLRLEPVEKGDSLFVRTHTISTSGNIDLTDKWSIRIGNIGYDFVNKRISYPDFGVVRSLHCWQMGLSTQPTQGTYQFYIRVSEGSSLSFLNVPWTKNIADRERRFLE